MNRSMILACVFAGLLVAAPSAIRTQPAPQSAASSASGDLDQHRALVTTYCATCHSTAVRAGGLALDGMDLQAAGEDAETWEKAIRKLRGRLMPPPGSPQPDEAAIDSFVGWLENTIDAHPPSQTAGHVPIQRLNRTEYAAAVEALVGVEVDPEVLPVDVAVDGFDNIAAVLTVSPSFVDQYVSAARSIARKAVGGPFLENVKYTVSGNSGGEAMPLGLRTGIRFEHYFPADGEYRVSVLFPDQTVGLYTGSIENQNTLVVMVDGQVMFQEPIGGLEDLMLNNRQAGDGRAQIMERFTKVPIQVQAGFREVVIGFIERSRFQSTANSGGGRFGGNQPGLGDVEIVGPYDPTGVSSLSRELIYVCEPETRGEAACARDIAGNLATRAFRRPVTDEDISRLMPFYEAGREEEGDFDRGIERLVTAVLVSPDFLYRTIRAPESSETELTDIELASRLSFFIWNTGPDRELLDLAIANRLSEPAALDAQVERMLADPKASSLVSGFAMKWLRLHELDSVVPDPAVFRGFNDQLRDDFLREAQMFIGSILLEDRSIFDLLTANHTFLNDRLAQHYGIEGVTGSQFRPYTLTDERRFGLLGKAAVLMRTSYGNRTSPVLRGAWVLDKLMGTPPTPPPPNVEAFPETQEGERPRTVRARLESHRNNPTCNQCHGVIDPIGLALENFDSIGEWRTTDAQAGEPIDARTVLPSGTPIEGPIQLREQLIRNPKLFAQVVTEKLMMYALGRELEYFDMPQVRAIVRDAANEDYRWNSIVMGVVRSDAFHMQGPASAEEPGGASQVAATN